MLCYKKSVNTKFLHIRVAYRQIHTHTDTKANRKCNFYCNKIKTFHPCIRLWCYVVEARKIYFHTKKLPLRINIWSEQPVSFMWFSTLYITDTHTQHSLSPIFFYFLYTQRDSWKFAYYWRHSNMTFPK